MVYWVLLGVLSVWFLVIGLFECGNVLSVWCFLELLTLLGMPLYFSSSFRSFSSLFYFLVVAGLSSFFLVAGVLMSPFFKILLLMSLVMKLGSFPFSGWVYRVVVGSNWLVVWYFSGLLKISFVLLFFGLGVSVDLGLLMNSLVVLTLIVVSMNFWLMSRDWYYVWCHMMLSSSVTLLAVAYSGDYYSSFGLYFCYLVWVTCVISFLSLNPLRSRLFFSEDKFCYFFLLVAVPGSLAVIYKLVVVFSLVGLNWLVLIFWSLCSVVEQGYLLNKFLSFCEVRSSCTYMGLI